MDNRKQRLKNASQAALGWVTLAVVFIVLPLALRSPETDNISTNEPDSSDTIVEADPTCNTEPIPYDSKTEYSDDYDLGTSEITQDGQDGEREVCMHDGEVVSNDVTSEPITEITTIGTYAEQQCEVTLCNDGTCSYSQGRGTCSWHGGVARYY